MYTFISTWMHVMHKLNLSYLLLEIIESKEECQQKKLKNYINMFAHYFIKLISEKFGYPSQYEDKRARKYFKSQSNFALLPINQNKEIQDFQRDESKANLIIKQPEGYCLSEHDRIIMYASQLCQKIRDAIYSQLQYKCSAGISINKMLAKLASSDYKPSQQTIILQYKLLNCLKILKQEILRPSKNGISQLSKMEYMGAKFNIHGSKYIGVSQ
ncbi:N-acetyltransferase eso1 [Paramecium bursaria]